MSYYSKQSVTTPTVAKSGKIAHRMFEKADLLQYTGDDNSKPIYLAVLGQV